MTYTLLPGTRTPVKVWTDPWTIEPEAAQQLRNIGSLPWVEGVAVMPDVHYGKGATVGSVEDLAGQTVGVECRKDSGVVDEIPGAYKDLDEVMKAQADLVEVVAHLKQVICVKG